MDPLEKFGKFFVENVRDKSLEYLQFMFDGKWKAPGLLPLQNKVSNLSPELKATVYELVEGLLTHAGVLSIVVDGDFIRRRPLS
jgi:hypothetical protein